MMRRVVILALLAACGGDSSERADDAWDPSSEDGAGTSGVGDESSSGGGDGGNEGIDSGPIDSSEGGDSGGSESTTGPDYDCTPAWMSTWIGSPCASDADCTYDGGVCLREDQGFPCGTCSQPCDQLCPDLDGAPETFCIDGASVGLPAAGDCVSKCDAGLLGGNGCRDGYGCATLTRFGDPSTSASVCVPDPFVPPATDCAGQLDALGASWEPSSHVDEHPDGYPELTCTIVEPVILYEAVPGLPLRYVDSDSPDGVLLGCEAALATARTGAVAVDMGAVELVHYGTYNCRPIAGTSTLSQHAFANAIDLYGFTLGTGEFWTVIDNWEDFVAMPVTPGGTWLRDLTDALWDMGVWHIMLTPEYNDDHQNHVHADLTPGDFYYYWAP
jgi:extensin-like protein